MAITSRARFAVNTEEDALGEGNATNVKDPLLWARIEAIDLSMVKMKLMLAEHGEPWTKERVDKVEASYRRYLYMTQAVKNFSAVPTKDIDAFWHQHILDTRAYARDCDAMFGSFLHHFPYFGLRGGDDAEQLQAAFGKTKLLYQEMFGEDYVQSVADCHSPGCGSKCGDDA